MDFQIPLIDLFPGSNKSNSTLPLMFSFFFFLDFSSLGELMGFRGQPGTAGALARAWDQVAEGSGILVCLVPPSGRLPIL